MSATPTWPARPTEWRLRAPDDVLLRRFGYVRAVGATAWLVAVAVLWWRYGSAVWPLALGVPILIVVTTVYFARSLRYPRALLTTSLAADALVLAGAVAFFGGTGSGLVLLQAIVIVSAGLLLGPGSAVMFTFIAVALALGQLGLEQAGFTPEFLHRASLGERLPILLASGAGLVSVGYLSATYGGRLHELIAIAGAEAADERDRGRRRRRYVEMAADDAQRRIADLREAAGGLGTGALDEEERARLAARLRAGLGEVAASVQEVADAAEIDRLRDARPEPISLRGVVDDCRVALDERLAEHHVTVDVPDARIVGDARAARRVVGNLLENVADHTPPGTRAHVAARVRGWRVVLAVTDDGPGVEREETLFEASEPGHVGLPLVRELCDEMGAEIRHQRPRGGGARFLVAFRLAPAAAPTSDERASDADLVAGEEPEGVEEPQGVDAARGAEGTDVTEAAADGREGGSGDR